jgi:predicted GIY-YIG superfamily endonuclease
LVYVEELPSKREMLIRELKLKRGNKEYFEKLIASPLNIVAKILKDG